MTKECKDCIYLCNPDKCNEYESCSECPNGIAGYCACTLEIPGGEERCTYYIQKSSNKNKAVKNDKI